MVVSKRSPTVKPLRIPKQWIRIQAALPMPLTLVKVRSAGGLISAHRMIAIYRDVYGQSFAIWTHEFGPRDSFEKWEEWLYIPQDES